MSLRFFADHCISNSIVNSLRQAGYEVLRLHDYLPKDSSDFAVISKANELNAILVSLNGDFSDWVMAGYRFEDLFDLRGIMGVT